MEQARGKRAAVIQHEAVETLGGNFTTVLEEAGFRLIPVPLYRGAGVRAAGCARTWRRST